MHDRHDKLLQIKRQSKKTRLATSTKTGGQVDDTSEATATAERAVKTTLEPLWNYIRDIGSEHHWNKN